MDIIITLDQQSFPAKLADNPTSRDLYNHLPLTLPLDDFAHEKIASLDKRLSIEQAPSHYQGKANDITYYAPWGNLAIFYGGGPNAKGLIFLGRFQEDVRDVLPHARTIRIEKVTEK
ncbi:hypothetical protein IX83_06150 [Basilea psittacipulmonis DSM 24701]|uniref:Cyclophilin-like domain-containing protein n=2 Tax=Basilea TaxID=1472344 RepID=A0A077DDJ7_9BURK|nr:hypothetical protein IX83_06150 [Basilea psittacipulmonis DSM 24701]